MEASSSADWILLFCCHFILLLLPFIKTASRLCSGQDTIHLTYVHWPNQNKMHWIYSLSSVNEVKEHYVLVLWSCTMLQYSEGPYRPRGCIFFLTTRCSFITGLRLTDVMSNSARPANIIFPEHLIHSVLHSFCAKQIHDISISELRYTYKIRSVLEIKCLLVTVSPGSLSSSLDIACTLLLLLLVVWIGAVWHQ